MSEDKREAICDMGYEDAIVFDEPSFDSSIIGVTVDGRVVYDYREMVQEMMNADGISEEDAIDFIEYNTLRSLPYAGDLGPVVMYPLVD